MSNTHQGECFCGTVKIELTGEPNMMGYCHCTDCAQWAGAPVNAFSLWSPENVKITAGEDKLGNYARTEASQRKFCTECGGHVLSDHPAMGMMDVYLNIVPTLDHQGTMHIFYGEKSMSVPDGLPKFKDMPSEFGGSGEMLSD
jgi:hypothetical protein